ELVERVVVLGEELPRDIEGQRIGSVLPDRVGKAVGEIIPRVVPLPTRSRLGTRATHFRIERAAGQTSREVECLALGAQASAVGRMCRIATHSGDAPVFAL